MLDIGAGPGRYSEYLLKELECRVGLIDLAEDSLKAFTRRVDSQYGNQIIFTKTSCATELDWVEDCSFDIVLLMGPLYHLLEVEERQTAIEHCMRILKPGGYVFAAFISPYAKYARLLKNGAERLQDADYIEKLVQQGQTQYAYENLVAGQYRCWPTQAREMMEAGGFETIRLRNLEGVGSFLSEAEKEILQNPELRQAWFDILRATCENPDLLGATLHFLYVGQKV